MCIDGPRTYDEDGRLLMHTIGLKGGRIVQFHKGTHVCTDGACAIHRGVDMVWTK